MITNPFTSAELAAHHDGMLLLKVRPPAGPLAARGLTHDPTDGPWSPPGLSALARLERAGMIKRVTPLAGAPPRGPGPPQARGVLAALGEATGQAPPWDANAGVCIVELERERDVPDLRLALANDPQVEYVARIPARYLLATARTCKRPAKADAAARGAPPGSTLWNLRKLRWARARARKGFKDAAAIRVAVLDTGIDPDHPDLKGRVIHYAFAHPDLPRAPSGCDLVGHGTHVAGVIGAGINNDLGINGICQCQLLAWKIFDDTPDASPLGHAFHYYVDPVMYRRALAECLARGVDVVNLSIGGPGRPDPQEQALFDALLARGTTVVAAMGNERRWGSPVSYPAAIPGVIAVGATGLDDTVADFSNRGHHIAVCAPGVAIWSTLPTYGGQLGFEAIPGPDGRPAQGRAIGRATHYDAWAGTSMAAPHVAGAAALLLANKGKMGIAAVRAALMQAAERVGGMGGGEFHPDYGAGRLDLLRLLKL